MRLYKKCSACEINKELSSENYSKHSRNRDGFNTQCKECAGERDAARYKESKDAISIQKKVYYQENKEGMKKKQRIYQKHNREAQRERERKWRIENPHKKRVIAQRRLTREVNAPSTLTNEEWDEARRHFKYACAYCGISEEEHLKINKEVMNQDHFIPLLSGGGHSKCNIIPSCRTCNSSKGGRDFTEWYYEHDSYKEERLVKILSYFEIEKVTP